MGKRWVCRGAWAAFAVAAGVAYLRLYFGAGVGDEVHYAAQALLPWMGGHWFVHELTLQQTSAILLWPIVEGYRLLLGTDAIVLFLRHLHFALSLVVAGVVYRALRYYVAQETAILLAALVLAFVPNAIASMTYNAMGSLFFGLASFSFLLGLREGLRRWIALAGACWVLAVFSYPTLVLAFGAFLLALGWWAWRASVLAQDPWRRVLVPFLTGAVPLAVGLCGILWSCGLENLIASMEFSSHFAHPWAPEKLLYAFYMHWVYLPSPYLIIPLLIVWGGVAWFRPQWTAHGLILFLALFFMFGGTYEAMPTQVLWFVLLMLSGILLLEHRGWPAMGHKKVWAFVLWPAFVGAIAACLTSRMTLYSMCLTGFWGALATVALFVGMRRAVGALVSVTLLVACLYWYINTIYEDEPIAKLNYVIRKGPFARLRTFQERGQFIEGIQADLWQLKIEDKTILFKDLFPGGYLMARNRVLGPTLYFAPALFYPEARAVYAETFARNPFFWPEIVVELKYYPIKEGQRWPYLVEGQDPFQDPFRDFFMQKSGAYDVLLDRPTHRFLKRRY